MGCLQINHFNWIDFKVWRFDVKNDALLYHCLPDVLLKRSEGCLQRNHFNWIDFKVWKSDIKRCFTALLFVWCSFEKVCRLSAKNNFNWLNFKVWWSDAKKRCLTVPLLVWCSFEGSFGCLPKIISIDFHDFLSLSTLLIAWSPKRFGRFRFKTYVEVL